jgi:hypothetical protein
MLRLALEGNRHGAGSCATEAHRVDTNESAGRSAERFSADWSEVEVNGVHMAGSTETNPLIPKIIDPARHAILDYATAGTFFAVAAYYRNRHRGASTLALLNGAAIVALSVLTDYPGGLIRTLSFRTHGAVDVALTAFAAAGPTLFGFADAAEARVFYSQAAGETAVVMATDFSSDRSI